MMPKKRLNSAGTCERGSWSMAVDTKPISLASELNKMVSSRSQENSFSIADLVQRFRQFGLLKQSSGRMRSDVRTGCSASHHIGRNRSTFGSNGATSKTNFE